MIYAFHCESCDHSFDVVKPVSEFTKTEICQTCKGEAVLEISSKVQFIGTSVQDAEYNPAFGRVVKNKYERTELAKKMNMVEVGSDFKSGKSMQKHFDKTREEKREKEWNKL